jgi:hypothetical protein
LAAVVLACVGVAFDASVNGFLATFPLLKPLAEPITAVLVGLAVGLTSAYVAYIIDLWFARGSKAATLREIDAMLESSTSLGEFSASLEASCEAGMNVARDMARSVLNYQQVGENLGRAARASTAALAATTDLVEWQRQHRDQREELDRQVDQQLTTIEQRIVRRKG